MRSGSKEGAIPLILELNPTTKAVYSLGESKQALFCVKLVTAAMHSAGKAIVCPRAPTDRAERTKKQRGVRAISDFPNN